MKITPSVKEMESIGFQISSDTSGLIIRHGNVAFKASVKHDAFGNPTDEFFWAGYNNGASVAGWSANSLKDAVNTLIEEEKWLSFHDGRTSMKKDFREMLEI